MVEIWEVVARATFYRRRRRVLMGSVGRRVYSGMGLSGVYMGYTGVMTYSPDLHFVVVLALLHQVPRLVLPVLLLLHHLV